LRLRVPTQASRVAARLFRLGDATVLCSPKQHITTGGVAANPMGGLRHVLLGNERVWLSEHEKLPYPTVSVLRAELLAACSPRVSYDAACRFMRVEGLFLKSMSASERADRTYPPSADAGIVARIGLIPAACSMSTVELRIRSTGQTNMTRTGG
jgi:hypothetical protein